MFSLLTEEVASAYLFDALLPVAKWVAIVALVTAVSASVIVFFVKRPLFITFVKNCAFALTIFAAAFGATLLIAAISKQYDAAYLAENYVDTDIIYYVFIPSAVTLVTLLAFAIALFVLAKRRSHLTGAVAKICAAVIGTFFVATLILIAVYYFKHIDGSFYTAEGTNFNQLVLYLGAILLIAAEISVAVLTDKTPFTFDAKVIARAGICVALSFALSFVTIFRLPQGGMVTLASALPVMLFAYAEGPKKGLLVGLVYGLLHSIQDPFIIHPAQFLLDYPIALSMLGFAGLFAKTKLPVRLKFALGAVLSGTLRFISHVLSGIFAFGAYAGDADPVLYSLGYNSFVFVDIAIVVVVGVIMLSSKSFVTLIKGQDGPQTDSGDNA